MRRKVPAVLAGAFLLLSAWVVSQLADSELLLAEAQENFLTDKDDGFDGAYEKSTDILNRLSIFLPDSFEDSVKTSWRTMDVLGKYQKGKFADLVEKGNSAGKSVSPFEHFVIGNSIYRNAKAKERDEAILKAIERYDEVMKADPSDFDAAFNKEFLLRQQKNGNSGRGNSQESSGQDNPSQRSNDPGQKKMESNFGKKGNPAKGENMEKFKTYVPKGEEDEKNEGATQGVKKKKKG